LLHPVMQATLYPETTQIWGKEFTGNGELLFFCFAARSASYGLHLASFGLVALVLTQNPVAAVGSSCNACHAHAIA
jgi:hypothetical protein